jgi:hypothetical protein
MARRIGIALLVTLAAPAFAGDPAFHAVVRDMETHFQRERTHIPLFGAVSFFFKVARPGGVKNLDLAVFEDLHYSPQRADELAGVLDRSVGTAWTPIVRVRSGGEWSSIYARGFGRNVKMIVVSVEPDEAAVVEVKLSADALFRSLGHPANMGKCLGGSGNGCEP